LALATTLCLLASIFTLLMLTMIGYKEANEMHEWASHVWVPIPCVTLATGVEYVGTCKNTSAELLYVDEIRPNYSFSSCYGNSSQLLNNTWRMQHVHSKWVASEFWECVNEAQKVFVDQKSRRLLKSSYLIRRPRHNNLGRHRTFRRSTHFSSSAPGGSPLSGGCDDLYLPWNRVSIEGEHVCVTRAGISHVSEMWDLDEAIAIANQSQVGNTSTCWYMLLDSPKEVDGLRCTALASQDPHFWPCAGENAKTRENIISASMLWSAIILAFLAMCSGMNYCMLGYTGESRTQRNCEVNVDPLRLHHVQQRWRIFRGLMVEGYQPVSAREFPLERAGSQILDHISQKFDRAGSQRLDRAGSMRFESPGSQRLDRASSMR